jgi:putative addiction module component (TIGR02574 family)
MGKSSQAILEEALKLPSNERAAVAGQLIQSLDPIQETEVEQAWQQEIQRRLTEIGNGEATTIPWEEVKNRLKHGS